MKLLSKFTNKELNLLNNVGIKIEDRDYSKSKIIRYENIIEEFIISHSTKNGDLNRVSNQYNGILNTLKKN